MRLVWRGCCELNWKMSDFEYNNDKGIPKEFDELRILRNNLTHITTNYESIKLEDFEIRELANTDTFDGLKKEDGEKALRDMKEFVEYILAISVKKWICLMLCIIGLGLFQKEGANHRYWRF